MDQQEDRNAAKESDFIKEVVKDKNAKKNTFVYRLICVLILAAAGAAVAAFVFALMLPVAQQATGGTKEETSKISIPEDELTPEPSGEPEKTVTETPAPTPTPTPEPEEKPEDEEKPSGETEQKESLDLEDYQKLSREILAVSEDAQKAIVTVTGITSQTDYFNQTYENTQQTSGVIIAQDEKELYILTDHSILGNVERIQVELADGYLIDALFQRSDPETGLAVLKADITELPEETVNKIGPVTLGNSLQVKQGSPIIALGSPMGYSDYISSGMITSVSNSVSVYDNQYTVFTTSIAGTNSGNGIILNLNGEVIGVIIRGKNDVSENTINAYSISQIKNLIEKLSNNEARPFLGIRGADVSQQISERTGVPKGLIITAVQEDSPAMIAGLMENDVIVGIEDEDIATIIGFVSALKNYAPDDEITVRAMRKGAEGYKEIQFSVKLGEI